MVLLACGINHKTAPLAVREQVSLAPQRYSEWLSDLIEQPTIAEVAVLSTCNRTELYCEAEQPRALLEWLSNRCRVSTSSLEPFWYAHQSEQAIKHILRVACGLDSLMLGEAQILGQVKAAYSEACECGTLGPQLHPIFQHVFATSKKIRTQTGIGANPLSIAYAGVQLAKHIFADFSQLTVLCIGAGDTMHLAAKHLAELGVQQFIVANRTVARSQLLANQFNGKAIRIGDVPSVLPQIDIIVSATSSQLPILGKGTLEQASKARRHKPMVILDLAVPRDIEKEVADLADIFLYNLDDLQNIVEHNRDLRQDAATEAESMIECALNDYLRWQQSLTAVNSIRQYRNQMQRQAQREVTKALRALQEGEPADKLIRELSDRLINKILHTPSVRLRKAGYDGRDDIINSIHYLFDDSD